MRDSSPPRLDASAQAALEEARFLFDFLKRYKLLDPDPVEGSDYDVRRRAKLELMNPQFDLSDDVRDYLLQLLADNAPMPAARKGQRPTKRRNFWIAQVVGRLVVDHGLKPTRNRASAGRAPQPTACEIVARALAEIGIVLDAASVEVIWWRRPDKDHFTDSLPWLFKPDRAPAV